MADDIPSPSTGEQADTPARRGGDDEGLRDAMAALLGLGSQGSNGGAGGSRGSSGISIPPPRQATPVADVEAPSVAAPPDSTPDSTPDDFWSLSDEPELPGNWSSSEALAPPDSAPDDFWSRPDEPRSATAWSPSDPPASPDPSTDHAWRPSLEPESPESWSAADAASRAVDREADDFWSSSDEPQSPGEPVGAPSVGAGPGPWAPLGSSSEGAPAADPLVPGDDGTDAPTAPIHVWPHSSGERHGEPASEAEGSSVAALQDVGLGGPLNAAMGDLRRLYPDADERVTRDAALPPAGPAGGGSPAHRRVQFLAAWWASRRKELVPGMVVGLVIVVAFAVVLLGRGGDSGPSGVKTTGSTTVPATDLTTVPGEGDIPPPLPLADEMVPAEPSTDSPEGGSSVSGDEEGAADAPPVVATTRPRRSGARSTPAPAPQPAPAATAPPAAPAPTAPPATPGPTQPPPPTATTAPPSPSPSPSDACDKLFSPAAREKCLEELRQGGND